MDTYSSPPLPAAPAPQGRHRRTGKANPQWPLGRRKTALKHELLVDEVQSLKRLPSSTCRAPAPCPGRACATTRPATSCAMRCASGMACSSITRPAQSPASLAWLKWPAPRTRTLRSSTPRASISTPRARPSRRAGCMWMCAGARRPGCCRSPNCAGARAGVAAHLAARQPALDHARHTRRGAAVLKRLGA